MNVNIKSKTCIFEGCNTSPTFNYKGEITPLYCSQHKEPDMINVKSKTCIFEGCKIIPTFNYNGEITPLYCSIHKKNNMIDIKNRKCIFLGCNSQPTFNYKGEITPLYCNIHKESDMINIKDKSCNFEGCKIKPCFNYEGEITPLYCSQHKEPDMINVKNKSCIFEGCKINPSFNYEGEITPLYCSIHKHTDMIDIKNKSCIFKGCKTIPSFNYKGEITRLYCNTHKKPDMINITKKYCIFKGCKTIPSFNYEGELNPLYCNKHKYSDMINVKDKNCEYDGCRTRANYNLPGLKSKFCATHKLDKMILNPCRKCIYIDELNNKCKNIAMYGIKTHKYCELHKDENDICLVETYCKKCGKIDIVDNNGLCINNCSLVKLYEYKKNRIKKHEEFINNLLNKEINIKNDVIQIWKDIIIDGKCTKERPDILYHCGNHVVIIEIDENQHKSYKNCGNTFEEMKKMENNRMYRIATNFYDIPVIFIRYNPDSFKDKNGNINKTIKNSKRHELLIQWVKKFINYKKLKDGIYVKYLFYDGFEITNNKIIKLTEKNLI